MASAKATLSQMFSWCPLGSRRLPTAQPQVESPVAITGSTALEHPRQRGVDDASVAPDLRQCEPWRHERLRETLANHDTTRIDRLSR